jgi:hypothetical protein
VALTPSKLSCMVNDGPVILIGVGRRRVGRDDGAVGACPRIERIIAGALRGVHPQEALYLPVMRALSMFPCGTEVIDNLLPHPIIVFAAYPLRRSRYAGW